jgi:hypothetical protein
MTVPAPVFVYVEDPGAANFVAEVVEALAAKSIPVSLFAGGTALAHLASLGVSAVPYDRTRSASANLGAAEPRLVLVGTAEDPDTPGLALIDAARDRNIASMAVVDGPMHAAARFRGRTGRPTGHCPDVIVVADEATRLEFCSLGFAPDSVLALGHPQFDRIRKIRAKLDAEGRAAVRARSFGDAAGTRKIALFLSELSDGMEPQQYMHGPHWTLAGRGTSKWRTDIAIEEFLDATAQAGLYRVLRLHPKNARDAFARYEGEFDAILSGGVAFEHIHASDIVVGVTTFLLVEAALLERPTVSILPDPSQRHWLPSAVCGPTRVVTDRAQIPATIDAALAQSADRSALKACFPSGAASRVADVAENYKRGV